MYIPAAHTVFCIADLVMPGLADSLTVVSNDHQVGSQPSAAPSVASLVGISRYALASSLLLEFCRDW